MMSVQGLAVRRVALMGLLVLMVMFVAGAPARASGWSSVQTVGTGRPGGNDATASSVQLAASPSGSVALAFQGPASTALLARRPVGGRFSLPEAVTLGAPNPPRGPARYDPPRYVSLSGLALPGRNAVLLAVNPDQSQVAQFQAAPGAALTPPQQLIPGIAGNGATGSVSLTSTPRGEVIADEQPNHNNIQAEQVQVLPRHASRFGAHQQVGRFTCGDTSRDPLAIDARGTSFVLALSGCQFRSGNALRVLRRPAGGSLRPMRSFSCPGGCAYAIGAGSNGDLAVGVTVGHNHSSVRLALGRGDRLGPLRALGPLARTGFGSNTTLDSPTVTSRGAVTFSWSHCHFGMSPCTISAVRADADGRVGRAQRLLSATTSHQAIDVVDGPNEVLAAICHSNGAAENHCTLWRWSGRPGLRLGPRRAIARGFSLGRVGRPLQLETDAVGDQLLPLVGDDGAVEALAQTAGSHRFTMRVLTRARTFPLGSLTAVMTDRREAVVAWMSHAGTAQAASDTFSG